MSEQVTLQKALFTIKKLKQLLQEKNQTSQPIAIVGLSCRFPQAVGKEAYWQLLSEGRNVISHMPERRWELLKGTHEAARRDPTYPYWGGFLSDIDAFDAYFFGISPREAARIDPQHRLLLEVAHEAFEDAGIPVEKLAGSNTGVFSSLYISQLAHMQKMDTEMDALYLPTGNAISIAANRLSYLLDLHGPSIIIDSACSSSMVSLHLACLNLQNKTCDTAIVCGAKLNLLPYVNFVLTKAKMLSVDGQCKTFDAEANGYVQGEGIGAVVLKPLEKALQDNDRIYAVINGSAVNQDGKTNGLTAPNGRQQELLLKQAYQAAHIQPQDISYVECHGTGTFLGDPIEIQALGEIVGKTRDAAHPCWIGSVKTNIGHLEPAAGIASIIKVALSLYHGKIPPHLNMKTPNPHLAFDKYQFKVPTQLENWPRYGATRIAGISGFGFGGTNAHIVMSEFNQHQIDASFSRNHDQEIFTLSAKDPVALSQLVEKWSDYLAHHSQLNLAQLCYLLHLRRSHYVCRLAIVCQSLSDVIAGLNQLHGQALDSFTNTNSIFIGLKKEKMQKISLEDNMNAKELASAYVSGASIDWQQYEASRQFSYVDLPMYPWQHKQYWPPLTNHHDMASTVQSTHPLQAKHLLSPLSTLQFEFVVDKTHLPDVQDTYNVVHAGYYMEIFAYIAKTLTQDAAFTIEDHAFLAPLFMLNDAKITVQVVLNQLAEDSYEYHFYSNTEGQKNWAHHAKGKIQWGAKNTLALDTLAKIQARSTVNEPAEKLYERILAMGMPAGESIRWTHQYWANDQEIVCEFKQPSSTVEKNHLYILGIHPGVIDASIQPIFKLLPETLIKPYIASGVKKAAFYKTETGPYYLYGRLHQIDKQGETITGDCYLLNANNQIIAAFEAITLTQLDNRVQIEKIVNASQHQEKIDLLKVPQLERKQYVIDFLIEQTSIIFSMPKADINVHHSLRDMGIDSLMAIVLMKTLEMGIGVNYSMQALLEGPTLLEIADAALAQTSTKTEATSFTKKDNPWIAYRQRQPNAKMRLFCFPYGGGGASIYREWQKELPDVIEVCPIQLPGREGRLNEKPIGNLAELVNLLIDNLQDEFDLPFAFFGHSFGSLIAFELARTLRKRQLPQPIHLFASAFPDPRTPAKSLDIILQQLQAVNVDLFAVHSPDFINQLNDKTLAQISAIFNENGIEEYGDHLMNKEIVKVLLPIFSGDMGIVKSYDYQTDDALDFPITIFAGKRDTWVAYEDHLQWGDHTSKQCQIHTLDSGHLFIKEEAMRAEVLQKIVRAIDI